MDLPKISVIILAAGGSSRLGHPKQLVSEITGRPLVCEAIHGFVAYPFHTIHLITGRYHREIINLECTKKVLVHQNEKWESGMGGSISFGLSCISDISFLDGIVVSTSDQPGINQKIVGEMWNKILHNQKSIVLAKYREGGGPPTYFPEKLFSQLLELKGEQGAYKIVKEHIQQKKFYGFPLGHLDIDTTEDIALAKKIWRNSI